MCPFTLISFIYLFRVNYKLLILLIYHLDVHKLRGGERPSVVLDRGQGADLKVLLLHRQIGAGGLTLACSASGATSRLLLSVGKDVGLEVGGLSEFFCCKSRRDIRRAGHQCGFSREF